jgi:hypothetical protein
MLILAVGWLSWSGVWLRALRDRGRLAESVQRSDEAADSG